MISDSEEGEVINAAFLEPHELRLHDRQLYRTKRPIDYDHVQGDLEHVHAAPSRYLSIHYPIQPVNPYTDQFPAIHKSIIGPSLLQKEAWRARRALNSDSPQWICWCGLSASKLLVHIISMNLTELMSGRHSRQIRSAEQE